jgi:predicted transposase YdaD
MQVVQESPIIRELREEWIAKGRAEGREEGIELGELKAALAALRQTLAIRFHVEQDEFDEQFERLEVESLKKLHETTLIVQSLKEFRDVLANMLSKLVKPSSETGTDK